MKTLTGILAGLVLLIAINTHAQVKGSPYVAADFGSLFLVDTDISGTYAKTDFDTGYRAGLHFGYEVPNGAALGFQGETATMDLAAELEVGTTRNSSFYQTPMLFNVAVIGHFSEAFSLRVGAGVGASWNFVDGDGFFYDEVVLAYQGFIKGEYRLNNNLSVSLFLSALSTGDTSFGAGYELERTVGFTTGLGVTWLFQ
jgi:hypothetical protein